MLDTPQRYPRAGSQSYPTPAAQAERRRVDDGYFGPTKPDGVNAGNWIQTDPEKGWFTILRLYSPLEPYLRQEKLAPERDRGREVGTRHGRGPLRPRGARKRSETRTQAYVPPWGENRC